MAHPVSGHVYRFEGKRRPMWRAKYRLPDGRQVKKTIGPAWTHRGRPAAGYFTKRTAEAWLREVLRVLDLQARLDRQPSAAEVDELPEHVEVVREADRVLVDVRPRGARAARAVGAARRAPRPVRRRGVRAEICERIRRASPSTKVLLISGAGRISPSAARAAGASGFVPKDWPARDIAEAVRMVARGMTVFRAAEEEAAHGLTEREREVLDLIASGATNREIAERLHLSPWTVKDYTGAVYRKLDVRNRTEAVQRGQRLGLLT